MNDFFSLVYVYRRCADAFTKQINKKCDFATTQFSLCCLVDICLIGFYLMSTIFYVLTVLLRIRSQY